MLKHPAFHWACFILGSFTMWVLLMPPTALGIELLSWQWWVASVIAISAFAYGFTRIISH